MSRLWFLLQVQHMWKWGWKMTQKRFINIMWSWTSIATLWCQGKRHVLWWLTIISLHFFFSTIVPLLVWLMLVHGVSRFLFTEDFGRSIIQEEWFGLFLYWWLFDHDLGFWKFQNLLFSKLASFFLVIKPLEFALYYANSKQMEFTQYYAN